MSKGLKDKKNTQQLNLGELNDNKNFFGKSRSSVKLFSKEKNIFSNTYETLTYNTTNDNLSISKCTPVYKNISTEVLTNKFKKGLNSENKKKNLKGRAFPFHNNLSNQTSIYFDSNKSRKCSYFNSTRTEDNIEFKENFKTLETKCSFLTSGKGISKKDKRVRIMPKKLFNDNWIVDGYNKKQLNTPLTITKINDEIKYLSAYIQCSPININDIDLKDKLRINKDTEKNLKMMNFAYYLHLNQKKKFKLKNKTTLTKNLRPSKSAVKVFKDKRNFNIKKDILFKEMFTCKQLDEDVVGYRKTNIKNYSNIYNISNKNLLSEKKKGKIKVMLLNYFLENYKDLISRILSPYFHIKVKDFLTNKKKIYNIDKLNYNDFFYLLNTHYITKDKLIIEQLFWIIDEEGKNSLSYIEFIVNIEIFNETTGKNKLNILFELLKNSNNEVSKLDFIFAIKKNIFQKDDFEKLSHVINNFFLAAGIKKTSEYFSYEEFKEGLKNSTEIINIIDENRKCIKKFSEKISNKIMKEMYLLPVKNEKFIQMNIIRTSPYYSEIETNKLSSVLGILTFTENKKLKLKQLEEELNENLE